MLSNPVIKTLGKRGLKKAMKTKREGSSAKVPGYPAFGGRSEIINTSPIMARAVNTMNAAW